MNQRSALLIAAAITAFLLALVAGLAGRLSSAPDLAGAEAPAAGPAALDPTVEALLGEREAAYQQALAEANARLEQANAQIAQANTQISGLEQSRQQLADQLGRGQAATPSYAVSAEQASAIALGAAPGAALAGAPELVRYQGAPAYEVRLDKGAVYVDAQSGAVLANGAAAPALVSQEQAIQAAQAYLGGGAVRRVELRERGGAQTYRVEFADDSKVYVDAAGGQVVYAEIRAERQHGGEDEGHEQHEGGEHEGDD